MKKFMTFLWVAVIIGGFVWVIYDDARPSSYHYYNRIGTIVQLSEKDSLSNDKFRRPRLCNAALIRDVEDTTLFCELTTCDGFPLINKAWYFNHRVGDTVRFASILRSRYFHIYPKTKS